MSRVYVYIKQYRDIASYSSLATDSRDYSTLSPCTLYTVHSTHYTVHSTQYRDIASYSSLAPDSRDYSTLSTCTLYTVNSTHTI